MVGGVVAGGATWTVVGVTFGVVGGGVFPAGGAVIGVAVGGVVGPGGGAPAADGELGGGDEFPCGTVVAVAAVMPIGFADVVVVERSG